MEQVLQRRLEIGFALLILAVLLVFFVLGLSYPARPRELPLLVDGIGLLQQLLQYLAIAAEVDVFRRFPGTHRRWRHAK